MAFTDEDKQKMNDAATDAEDELNGVLDNIDHEFTSTTSITLTLAANWWKRWYPHAGHKRLAHILLQYASKEEQP